MPESAWDEMRTSIMFGAYFIYEGLCNIARSNGYNIPSDDRSEQFIAIMMIVVMVMDIVDFFRG